MRRPEPAELRTGPARARRRRLNDEELRWRDETEDDLTGWILDVAHLCGWRVAHFRPARTKGGWRTAVQGDGAGFPDLILVRGTRLIAAELKRELPSHRPTPEQRVWLDTFASVRDCGSFVWRPSHRGQISALLSAQGPERAGTEASRLNVGESAA
ncbi:MAG: hypothetical protein M3024_12725 [Candidatus Dormibacteraeota bacterium]|nr:hypothetical protein [Candidatus Dormibacteraeota bacterium]